MIKKDKQNWDKIGSKRKKKSANIYGAYNYIVKMSSIL